MKRKSSSCFQNRKKTQCLSKRLTTTLLLEHTFTKVPARIIEAYTKIAQQFLGESEPNILLPGMHYIELTHIPRTLEGVGNIFTFGCMDTLANTSPFFECITHAWGENCVIEFYVYDTQLDQLSFHESQKRPENKAGNWR